MPKLKDPKTTPSTPAAGASSEVAGPREGLISVTKGGRILHIHPGTLASHKLAGWKPVK